MYNSSDKVQPLLGSDQGQVQDEPYYYVLHFPNPYDPNTIEMGGLGTEIDKEHAEKLLHNSFKIIGEQTLNLTRFLARNEKEGSPDWIIEDIFKFVLAHEEKIPTKNFLEYVMKTLLIILQRYLKFRVEMFHSRDNDEIFIKLWLSEENLKIHADLIDYQLQLKALTWRERLKEDREGWSHVAPYAKYDRFKPVPIPRDSSRSHSTAQYEEKDIEINYKHYDEREVEIDNKPGFEGKGSIFTYRDKVRLVFDLINHALDANYMVESGIMLAHYPIHKEETRQALKRAWVSNLKVWESQDLDKVRSYFGEKVGLFFAWLEFYRIWMFIPAGFGLLTFIIQLAVPFTQDVLNDLNNNIPIPTVPTQPAPVEPAAVDPAAVETATPQATQLLDSDPVVVGGLTLSSLMTIIYTAFVVLTSCIAERFWVRKERTLAWRWGVSNFRQTEAQRPKFVGEYKIDPISEDSKKYHPDPMKLVLYRIAAWSLVVLFMCVDLLVIWSFFYLVSQFDQANGNSYILGTLIGVQIQVMGFVFTFISRILTDFGGYETQTEYDNSLTLKFYLFQFVNSYGPLFYIAFARPYFEKCYNGDCVGEMRAALLMILIITFLLNLLEIFFPFIKQRVIIWWEERKVRRMQAAAPETQSMRVEMSAVEEQAKLDTYKSSSDARFVKTYMDVVNIYGYAVMFSCALPLLPLIALGVIILVIKVDSWRLCVHCKRTFPERAKSIGIWTSVMTTLSLIGSFSNAAILLLTHKIFGESNWELKCIALLSIQVAIILFRFIIEIAFDKSPSIVKKGLAWGQRHARQKLDSRHTSIVERRNQWTLHPQENPDYVEIPFAQEHVHADNFSAPKVYH
jgi:hypothetical protein